MNAEESRKKIEALSITPSDESFFKYLKAGDRELIELLLDSGISPDVCDKDRKAAVTIAVHAGQKELARLLLARGASPEPLLNVPASKKDNWDKIAASSAILSFLSGVLIAFVGGYFTYSYNKRQSDLNAIQAQHESASKEQANKILELDAVQKLIPTLISKDEREKGAALIAIQDLAHPELAAHLAEWFKGSGSVQYLQQAALSENVSARKTAVQALSNIASRGPAQDSQLASRALSSVFENARDAVVKITASDKDQQVTGGSGIILTADGYILTTAHLFDEGPVPTIYITTFNNAKLPAERIAYKSELDLAILKVAGAGLTPIRLASDPPRVGSDVIGIGYAGEERNEMALVGSVASVDAQSIYFSGLTFPGSSGGPLLNNGGEVVGLMHAKHHDTDTDSFVAIAIRGDVALEYVRKSNVPIQY